MINIFSLTNDLFMQLWNQLVSEEVFWRSLYEHVYLFASLKDEEETWKQSCLRINALEPQRRTDVYLFPLNFFINYLAGIAIRI